MVKGFLNEKCKVLQYKLYVQRGSSFQHLIVAGHRHRCRCRRYRHSGILASIALVGYRTGSTNFSTGLVPALALFIPVPAGPDAVPSSIKFFVPSFLLSHWSISQCTLTVYIQKMAGFRDNFEDNRRHLEHLLKAQSAIGKLEQAS